MTDTILSKSKNWSSYVTLKFVWLALHSNYWNSFVLFAFQLVRFAQLALHSQVLG